jgi:gamma-glutamyltranspeptidase/glutathione hydrolase
MNNGMMWFDPRADKPNSMAPGKRPLSNMCPTLFSTADGSYYALGASGGRRIMPAVMQLLSSVVDRDMDINTAVHTPRIDVSGSDQVCVDSRLEAEVAQQLDAAGHNVLVVPNGVYPAMYACPNIIGRSASGINTGAAFVASPWAEVALQEASGSHV